MPTILVLGGAAGLRNWLPISVAIAFLMLAVGVSYQVAYKACNRVSAVSVRVCTTFKEVVAVTAPTHVPSMETHPDIVELRARYERISLTPVGQAAEALAIAVGLYLAVSAWIVGFNGFPTLAVNNLVTGLAYAFLIGGFGPAFERSHARGWAACLIGLWTIIAPWAVYGTPATARTITSNVIAGALALCLALAMCSFARGDARRLAVQSGRTQTPQSVWGWSRHGEPPPQQPAAPDGRTEYPTDYPPGAGPAGPGQGLGDAGGSQYPR
ncbi:SPW repeat protein [Streptomyces humicola]|uniref:SPW repeat protein n=1 Tax=Streptomyces humicola TaxID=2953240 RepID=UPI0027E2C4EB|nr:SPW repeat protein [Streptomyces humicola]